jgi:peptidoglycan hydrolase-like protein with peptidoglycan-binding domain
MWVTIYFEDRDEIKWTTKERLGAAVPQRQPAPGATEQRKRETPTQGLNPNFILLVQGALSLLGLGPGPLDGIMGEQTRNALREFQRQEKLAIDGTPKQATCLALVTSLYRKYPENAQILDLASQLLSAAGSPSTGLSGIPLSDDVIESHIRGNFEGWEGETLFFLDNGQIWQQASYAYTYHYAYRPKVIIYKTGGGHKMSVEGVSDSIYVKRIK